MKDLLFITGMPRSGTTLVDKLLSMHPDVFILSQPLPLLFVEFKKQFLLKNIVNITFENSYYPLNDMFLNNYYDIEEFVTYLDTTKKSGSFYHSILNSMIDYDGQYTKIEPNRKNYNPNIKMVLYEFVNTVVNREIPQNNCLIYGLKEIFCEEYIPYFLNKDLKVIQIVRDPRDVITSLNFGNANKYSGKNKPLLFDIRQWRKSVAFMTKFASHDNFMSIKYEDLVSSSGKVLNSISNFLGIDNFNINDLEGEITSQNGEVWHSNSSHNFATKINVTSVGRYKDYLSEEIDKFVQACCFFEMKLLGYELDIDKKQVYNILESYQEYMPLKRLELEKYQWSAIRLNEEICRLNMLINNKYKPEYFLFAEVFKYLLDTEAFS